MFIQAIKINPNDEYFGLLMDGKYCGDQRKCAKINKTFTDFYYFVNKLEPFDEIFSIIFCFYFLNGNQKKNKKNKIVFRFD